MAIFSYRTIIHSAEGLYKEKGSRFLAFAYPVSSGEAINEHLEGLRKKFYDARHHCYAWVLGPGKESYRAFDDGEPNHSAGDPILGQIRRRDLTDVLVIVVRYFGGTKLGVGGLITAYRAAADDALNHAGIVERAVMEQFRLRFEYPVTADVMRLVKDFDLVIAKQDFGTDCSMTVLVPLKVRAALIAKIELLQATGSPLRYELA